MKSISGSRTRATRGLGCLLLFLFSLTAAGAQGSAAAPARAASLGIALSDKQAASLLERYGKAINSLDPKKVAALYDEGALLALVYPGGRKILVRGRAEIQGFYAKILAEEADQYRGFRLGPPSFVNPRGGLGTEANASSETLSVQHHVAFSGKAASPLILRHLLESEFIPGLGSSPFLAWADGEGNGALSPLEQKSLVEALRRFRDGRPRAVQCGLDRYFDFDLDLSIDDVEAAIAAVSLLRDTMRRLATSDAAAAGTFFGGEPSIHGANRLLALTLFRDPESELQMARLLGAGEEKPEDLDGDGVLRLFEIDAYARLVIASVALYPRTLLYYRDSALGAEGLRAWADLDRNGRVEGGELTDLGWETMETQRLMAWNPADSLALRFFDSDENAVVEEPEALRARAFVFDYLFPRAQKEGLLGLRAPGRAPEPFSADLDRDGDYDRGDAELLSSLLLRWGQEGPPSPPPPSLLRAADENGDSRVDEGEFNRFCTLGWTIAAAAWLASPPEELAAFRIDPEAFLRRLAPR